MTCLFCGEPESVNHVFFYCCVVRVLWSFFSGVFGFQLVGSFEVVAKWWISRKKHAVLNMRISAVLWSVWKLRNDFCFQGARWVDERVVLRKVSSMLRRWTSICKVENMQRLEEVVAELDATSWEVSQRDHVGSSSAFGVLHSGDSVELNLVQL